MSTLKKLFNAMNLHIEENKTVTKIENGIKSTVQCNNKFITTDNTINQVILKNGNQSIVFSTHSKVKDCIYLFLEQHVHEALSLKVSFIISKILKLIDNPELYNNIKSQKLKQLLLGLIRNNLVDFDNRNENSLLNKWEIINEKISQKSLQDGIISLNYKIDNICVENTEMIEDYRKYYTIPEDEKCTFAFFNHYISIKFPIYNFLKQSKTPLLGVDLEKNDIEVIKSIYQYIFENIQTDNDYNLLDNPLLKDKINIGSEKVYFVNQIKNISTPTMQLIETFNTLAAHIDEILDDMVDIKESLVKNEKFNLNLSKEEISELKSYNEFISNSNFSSANDFKGEIKSNPRISFKEFNGQINVEAIKNTNQKAKRTNNVNKRQSSINKGILSITTSCALEGVIDYESQFNILDSTSKSFEFKIPDKERKRHTYILAGSGAGKTSLLETFLYKDCQSIEQSTIVFDLMGKATNSILKFVEDTSKVLIIDPYLHPSITPIINPLELEDREDELAIENRSKAIINASDIALKLKDGWTVNQKAVLEPCLSTLVRKGGFSFESLQRMMNDEHNHDLVALGKKSPVRGHRNFFLNEFHNESYDVTKRAISAKLQVFLNDPTFANLTLGKSTINLKKEINTKGKIIIFKLPSKQKLFARLMMEMIQDIMKERANIPENDIVPTNIYLDEFQHYITSTIEEILTESRNYKFYVTFAHQSFVQLSKKMQGIVLSNSNIKIIGQCSYDNGKKMSKEMKADFEIIEDLDQGEFVFKIGAKNVIKLKNTDKFINDKTPYHTRQRIKHMKHQFKKYYDYKEVFTQFEDNDISKTLKPKHEDF